MIWGHCTNQSQSIYSVNSFQLSRTVSLKILLLWWAYQFTSILHLLLHVNSITGNKLNISTFNPTISRLFYIQCFAVFVQRYIAQHCFMCSVRSLSGVGDVPLSIDQLVRFAYLQHPFTVRYLWLAHLTVHCFQYAFLLAKLPSNNNNTSFTK